MQSFYFIYRCKTFSSSGELLSGPGQQSSTSKGATSKKKSLASKPVTPKGGGLKKIKEVPADEDDEDDIDDYDDDDDIDDDDEDIEDDDDLDDDEDIVEVSPKKKAKSSSAAAGRT